MRIDFVLISDGSADRVLLPILMWLLDRPEVSSLRGEWAEPMRLGTRLQLHERIHRALEVYDDCNLLFVHRDAERMGHAHRVEEIHEALRKASVRKVAVCVVPVRMQEAWLLIDEPAIRKAAGNPNGKVPLQLPSVSRLEEVSDPKDQLHGLLRKASELGPRRLKNFNPDACSHRVAHLIGDYSPLRSLPAFRALEIEITGALTLLNEGATS